MWGQLWTQAQRFAVISARALGLALLVNAVSGPALGQIVYPEHELQAEADRLKTAVKKIHSIGLEPVLTPQEAGQLETIQFSFPMPRPDDPILNFYAVMNVDRGGTVIMPILSLKAIEDMTLAYAWLVNQRKSLEPIDLYFSMIANQPAEQFPGGRPPDILTAIGIPKDAYKLPGVDKTSLALRNEAFAFILAHELGHLRFRHKGLREITAEQARADEVESDLFALDLLARTRTAPLGAALFFQAQVYSLPHPAEFPTRDGWEAYLAQASTHPLSYERIRSIGQAISNRLALVRPTELAIWQFIGGRFLQIADILADEELHRCIAGIAKNAPLSILRAQPMGSPSIIEQRKCK